MHACVRMHVCVCVMSFQLFSLIVSFITILDFPISMVIVINKQTKNNECGFSSKYFDSDYH